MLCRSVGANRAATDGIVVVVRGPPRTCLRSSEAARLRAGRAQAWRRRQAVRALEAVGARAGHVFAADQVPEPVTAVGNLGVRQRAELGVFDQALLVRAARANGEPA